MTVVRVAGSLMRRVLGVDLQDELKKHVAAKAADLVRPNMVLGLGSGSTAAFFVADVGRRVVAGELPGLRCVPTSFQASVLANENSLTLTTLNEVDTIDLAVDGADEVDPHLNLTKGGGGCQTEEKLVDARAEQLVIVVDSSKLVHRLGEKMPIPVEVLPLAYRQVGQKLTAIGGKPTLRMAKAKAGPLVTDQGNFILDTEFEQMDNPGQLEEQINNIPGVLDNGLFVGLADKVLVGEEDNGKLSVREL